MRADASISIGAGHVMRCLTLADVPEEPRRRVPFICRLQPGHLFDLIRARGHAILAVSDGGSEVGRNWAADAAQTRSAIGGLYPDWLIVDHYQLGLEWECEIKSAAARLLAIE